MGVPLEAYKHVNGVPTFQVESPGFNSIDDSPVPYLTQLSATPPATETTDQGLNWWILLLVAGGIYLIAKDKR